MTVAQEAIPASVVDAYYGPAEAVDVTRLAGGEINETWLAEERDRRTILQCINPAVFGALMLADNREVTEALAEQGWVVPLVMPARDGSDFVEDGGFLWRKITFIESDEAPAEADLQTHWEYGRLLAQTHQSLAAVDYEPQFELADGNFHNTSHYIGELKKVANDLPDAESQQLANDILTAYEGLPALPEGPEQLLHGDPRTNNMLFRDGRPFTYIDWDTLMKGSIWIDVGDLMRSLVEDSILKRDRPLEVEKLRAFAEGYRENAMPDADPEEFFGWACTAMQRIALELTSRFAADINGNYFATDPAMTRRDYCMMRASTQWQIYAAYNRTGEEK